MVKNWVSKKLKCSKAKRKLSTWKLLEKMILGKNYEQGEEESWNWRQPAWKAGTPKITARFL
jgi:hypothetical protein